MKNWRVLSKKEQDEVAKAMRKREIGFTEGIANWAKKANKRAEGFFKAVR